MKNLFLIICLFFAISNSYSQIDGEDEVYLNGDFIEPKFEKGGIKEFQEFILKNFDAKTVEKAGQLIFEFTINVKGEIKNIKILRELGGTSADEIIRVLRLAPKLEPALRGGKPVSVNLKIPLTFK